MNCLSIILKCDYDGGQDTYEVFKSQCRNNAVTYTLQTHAEHILPRDLEILEKWCKRTSTKQIVEE